VLIGGDKELNALRVYSKLTVNQKTNLLSRIQHWVDGFNKPKEWFHGSDEEDYEMCFVFKLGYRRFYGYLCNPTPNKNASMVVCVVCSASMKHKWETDPAEKKLACRMSKNSEVMRSLNKVIPDDTPKDDRKGKNKQWKM
jgi:hypothetical protein